MIMLMSELFAGVELNVPIKVWIIVTTSLFSPSLALVLTTNRKNL